MAFSFNTVGSKAAGDTISVPFPYTSKDDVYVLVDGEEVSSTLYSWSSGSTLLCLSGFPEGTTTRVERRSSAASLPSEQQGTGTFDYDGANRNDKHLMFIAQERVDVEETVLNSATQVADDLASTSAAAAMATIKAEAASTSADEASTSADEAAASASTATTKASEAAASASTATTKAGEASTSADEAAASASTATTKAGEASTSADEAAASAVAAAAFDPEPYVKTTPQAFTPEQAQQGRENIGAALRGHLYGLTISNSSGDSTNDIDISVGEAASEESEPSLLSLTSAMTKRTDASWAAGSGGGGWLDGASMPNGTGHVFLIQRSDTGETDVGLSASLSPTLPSNYDRKRRVGSILRVSGGVVGFRQVGDRFLYKYPIVDFASTVGLTYVAIGLSVPLGLTVVPEVLATAQIGGGTALVYLGNADVAAPGTVNATFGNYNMIAWAGTGASGGATIIGNHLYTTTSGEIYALAGAAGTSLYIATLGYLDYRGRM
jgi:hypothetical protein